MIKKISSAFTLIELLIVIAVIAILASFALPAFLGVQERAKQTKDLSNGKQIVLSLRQFALDNNGAFPQNAPALTYGAGTPLTSASPSNDALWWLFPTYLTDEFIFAVPGSAWNITPGPNGVMDPAGSSARADTLAAGENGYAYTLGLNDTSDAGFPVLEDGMIVGAASPWNYTTDKTIQGGVWGGKKAILIFVDGSGQVMKCDDFISGPTAPTVFRPGSTADSIFQESSTPATVTWLNASTNPILQPQ
jgi:prepilin-type N-terminal cleavage/methylation domain-containing protein